MTPNSYASFNCVVEEDMSTNVMWIFKQKEIKFNTLPEPEHFTVSWNSRYNTSLNISTKHIELVNTTEVVCKASNESRIVNNTARIVIAGV